MFLDVVGLQPEPIAIEQMHELGKSLAASRIIFRELPAGDYLDWHPAPRRQIVIMVSGRLEIELEDGSKHRFGPGDARLVEDLTGRGHARRVCDDQPCVTATIALAPQ